MHLWKYPDFLGTVVLQYYSRALFFLFKVALCCVSLKPETFSAHGYLYLSDTYILSEELSSESLPWGQMEFYTLENVNK